MPLLVHIAPQNAVPAIRHNGIAPTRWKRPWQDAPELDRAVWAFPVLPSYTLTHSWSRELKRFGRTALAAVTFRLPEDEPVYARHFSQPPQSMTAVQAAGLIRAAADPRGYEIMIPRRIRPSEIVHARALPKAIGWRYWPEAKGKPLRTCDCPVCMPRGEVKARRYREAVRERMRQQGYRTTEELTATATAPQDPPA